MGRSSEAPRPPTEVFGPLPGGAFFGRRAAAGAFRLPRGQRDLWVVSARLEGGRPKNGRANACERWPVLDLGRPFWGGSVGRGCEFMEVVPVQQFRERE